MSGSREDEEVWYRQAVDDRDAESAFRLAESYLRRSGIAGKGPRWFEYAATLDPSADMLWRIADVCATTLMMEPASSWMRRAISAEWAGCEVEVDPDVFPFYDYDGSGRLTAQAFEVQVTAEPAGAARAALEAASSRFSFVYEDGEEFYGEDDGIRYRPNWVSDIYEDAVGPWLTMDCKSGVMPFMARTDIRIIVEELRRAGATSGRILNPTHGNDHVPHP